MKPTGLFVLGVALLVGSNFSQLRGQPVPGSHTRSQAATQQASFKAIFEAVSYGQDINLTDVFFVGPDVGWVSGEHATILQTTDAGKSWTAQVGGDPAGDDKPIGQLRFLDQNHGWAIQDKVGLLRTLDGHNWEKVNGEFPPGVPVVDYAFTSVRHGLLLGGNGDAFYVTDNGGRSWRSVMPCRFTANVQGLAQAQDCHFSKLQMLSATSAVALAWSSGPDMLVLFRTDDAGGHWTSSVPDVRRSRYADMFFTDVNHGVIFFDDDQETFVTADAGRSWRALLSGKISVVGPLRFADPEVGWVLGPSPDNSDTFRVSFTTDGGQHWKASSNIGFPPGPRYAQLKFAFPRRDSAYVIGPHGMIYRYRIVPASYAAAHALEAPMMPGFGATELAAKADVIRRDIEALRSKLPQLAPGAVAAADGNSAPGAAGASDSASAAPSNPTATAGGPVADASSSQDASAASGGFVQDTTPPSAAIADCCAAALQQLQTDTAGFVTQIPAVTTQYRPLNLVVAGVQLASSLINQGHSLWTQFRSFKHAPTIQAASQALQQLSTILDTVQHSSSSGFENPGGWFAANAPASFVQDIGPGAASTGQAMPGGVTSAEGSAASLGAGSREWERRRMPSLNRQQGKTKAEAKPAASGHVHAARFSKEVRHERQTISCPLCGIAGRAVGCLQRSSGRCRGAMLSDRSDQCAYRRGDGQG